MSTELDEFEEIVVKLNTVYGNIKAPDWPDDLIVRSLSAFGEWSAIEVALFARLIRKDDLVWDGGAFLGTFGLGAAQIAAADHRKPSKLIAIDPSEELQPAIRANLKSNAPCPFEIATCAIGPASSQLVPVAGNDETNHGALRYSLPEDDALGTIESRALWQLRESYGDYDVIKLDIEGMESVAVRSDFDYLQEKQPVVWSECNEALASLETLEAMVALGYDPLYLAFPAFRTDNFNRNENLFFPMAYEAALLAAPSDRLAEFTKAGFTDDVIVRPVRSSWDLRQALWATPRWATEEWSNMSRAELVALMGRLTRGEDLSLFLNDSLGAVSV